MAKKMKAYKVKISGSYKGHENEIFDFTGLEGVVPYNTEEIAKQHIKGRFVSMWILKNPEVYKNRLQKTREVYYDVELVDSVTTAEFSYVGKDVKQMTWEELQDLAIANDLKAVPLYKKMSLRQAQEISYADYYLRTTGKVLDRKAKDYNYSRLKPLIADDKIRQNKTKTMTNEEVIEREQHITDLESSVDTSLSLDDLKAIADEKNIPYHATIGRAALYKKLYGTELVETEEAA